MADLKQDASTCKKRDHISQSREHAKTASLDLLLNNKIAVIKLTLKHNCIVLKTGLMFLFKYNRSSYRHQKQEVHQLLGHGKMPWQLN